jgi:tetratricopeptide (TPR) repeat protein
MAKPQVAEPIPDPTTLKANTPADYAKRGWLYFSRQNFDLAIQDFRHILSVDANDIDAWYGLGLAQKSAKDTPKALEAFEKVLNLIVILDDSQRASILSRLAKGQINQIKTGDWNLEKEVWKSV